MIWVDIYRPGAKPLRMSSGTEDMQEARMIESALKLAHGGKSRREKLHAIIDAVLPDLGAPALSLPLASVWPAYEKAMHTAGRTIATMTARKRRRACERFAQWCADHWPRASGAHQVDRACAVAFSDWLAAGTPGSKTRRNLIGDLSAVWRILGPRWGLDNPWRDLMPANTNGRSGRAFSREEEDAVFAEAKRVGGDWWEVCMVARYTGLRYGDVARLLWASVDLPGARLTLTPTKTARHGIDLGIPMHPDLRKMFFARPRGGKYVFPEHADRYHGRHDIPSQFGHIMRAAGLDIESDKALLTFQCWRHTFRTRMSEAGVPQEIAMVLGGWTRPETAGLYSHDWGALEKAINGL